MTNARQAAQWIAYWREMRGVPARAFTIAEYLPGRDFACQSLWKNGELVLVKTVERLSYFGGGSQPSGASSIAALAKTVVAPNVVDVCTSAIRALGRRITGAFSVDLKENRRGRPCITEINVGRFITMLNFFDLTGDHNMALTYVRLALDQPVDIGEPYDQVEDYYFVRDVDALPGIFHAEELFEGISDARDDRRGVASRDRVARSLPRRGGDRR
jgi:carbamoyl-phosphate synthase large subunit